jgi:glutamine synthetase
MEALENLDKDTVLKDALGEEIYTAFRRAKLEEWEDFRINVTDWEVEKYLESA